MFLLLAAALPVDPPTHRSDLGAAEYAVREQAESRLVFVCCARPAASSGLLEALAADSCPEVRSRAAAVRRRVSAVVRARAAAEVSARYGLLPFLDSFWFDPGEGKYLRPCDLHPWHAAAARVAAGYLEAARPDPAACLPGDGYGRYREATRLLLVEARSAGVAWAELDVFVTLLRVRDFVYCGRNPAAVYAPPLAGR